MFLKEKNFGFRLEEPGVIPLFKTVDCREQSTSAQGWLERVLKRGMAHGSPGGQSYISKAKKIAAFTALTDLLEVVEGGLAFGAFFEASVTPQVLGGIDGNALFHRPVYFCR